MTKKCIDCGRPSPHGYPRCWDCFVAHEREKFARVETYDPDYDPSIEQPESEFCVMCGREWGTYLRKDGKYYCSLCWTVWNS